MNNQKFYESKVEVRSFPLDVPTNLYWQKEDNSTFPIIINDWNLYLKDWVKKYTKKFDVVVQAGGNHGVYPLLLSRVFKIIYTFEPDPLSYFCLVNNCQQDNIVKINAALGSEPDLISIFHQTEQNTGMHYVVYNENSFVPQLKLDGFYFKNVDLLFLDVENYELNVLKGALETIQKHLPTIILENNSEEIENLLKSFGYILAETQKQDSVYIVGNA